MCGMMQTANDYRRYADKFAMSKQTICKTICKIVIRSIDSTCHSESNIDFA